MLTEPVKYTTEDEIAFLREMEREGKRAQLRQYRKSLPHREFAGEGMFIDRSKIETELNRILGRETPPDETYEEYVVRTATQWLEGGRLRRLTQRRAVDELRMMPVPKARM